MEGASYPGLVGIVSLFELGRCACKDGSTVEDYRC